MSDNSAYGELRKFVATETGMAAYAAWISDPVTQKVLLAGRELSRPRTPRDITECPLVYGECLGANKLLDFMISPFDQAADGMRGKMPATSYRSPVKQNEDNQ